MSIEHRQPPSQPPSGRNRRRRRLRTLVASGVAALAATASLSVGHTAGVHAGPIAGNSPWLVLLCQAKGTTTTPKPPAYFQHLFAEHDSVNPTVWDYWWQVSNYSTNLLGTTVSTRWMQTAKTVAELQTETREQKLSDCIAAAGPEIASPESYYGVLAMWNTNFTMPSDTKNFGDSGETGGLGQVSRTINGVTQGYAGVVLEPWAMFPSFIEHEMGHGYGLDHAFGNVNCNAVAQAGEYCDPFDTMGVSTGGLEFSQPAYAAPGGGSSLAGPGLDAFELAKLGFIPAGRTVSVTPGAGQQYTETITSLSAPNASGLLTVTIPLGDSPDHYDTIEFRRRSNWDAGINNDGILIHEVKPNAIANHPAPLSFLVNSGTASTDGVWIAGRTYTDSARQISITVQSVDLNLNQATVIITGPPAPPPPPLGGVSGSGQGSGGCGASGCGQHPPGWRPKPIPFM